MTDSFGTRLRREREQRQIRLADIAAQTKIKASIFEELERDDVSHWPAGIFRRSFMRAYAQAIGLDPDEAVREFIQRFPDPSDAATAPPKLNGSAVDVADAGALDLSYEASTSSAQLALAPSSASGSASASGLRLTLVENGLPFTGGRLLADVRQRWPAAAWDLGSLVAIALSVFVVIGAFWVPFAVTALCYYVGGVLLLGNSPGVCLFPPRDAASSERTEAPRATRQRYVDVSSLRHAAAGFRSKRWKQEVHS